MLRRCLALLALLLAVSLALGQYNEKEIISQRAYQMLAQRQFTEAERLFGEVLQRWPDDANSVLQLLNIYFQTSQLDKAENMLNQYRRIIPPNQYAEQEILLAVMQGKPDTAWKLSLSYLQRQNYNENAYRLLASYFERRGFYDQVIQLYQDARRQRNNPELFRLETANASLNYRLFDQAITEYLAFLDKNSANLYFINNQIITILMEDPTRIKVIGNYAARSENAVVKELYANALVSRREYSAALEVYKKLPREKVVRFAEEQYLALNDEIALPSFAYLAQTSSDAFETGEYRLRQAQIHYRNGEHQETKLLLEQIMADPLMQERRNIQRKGVNLEARKLMAENSLALSRDTEAAQNWYNEARNFCTNSYDLQTIELALVNLSLIRQDYEAALATLDKVDEPKHRETRDYLQYSAELLRGNTDVADSLMNAYIIRYPAGIYVNDAIYQMMFVLGLEGAQRDGFLSAWRLMLLRDSAAVDSLASLFVQTSDEELLTLAVEWAILLADKTRASELLEHDWQDPISAEYAALLKLLLTKDNEAEQRMAREFLKANPNSIFAPKFRQSLSRLNSSRPEY
ncbi:MAG: tetratricopeptide repeat protein [Candidatus Syntrophosphaera sp.]|nr:tetratricopeptide repeat protein [Candidatus Syntrophosphaera sp.]